MLQHTWRRLRLITVLCFMSAVVLLLAGCGQGGKQAANQYQQSGAIDARSYERSDNNGGLQLDITWLSPEYLQTVNVEVPSEFKEQVTTQLAFDVTLTTHTGDVTQFDFAANSSLKINGQNAGKGQWQWLDRDPHHGIGLLTFPPNNSEIQQLELNINNLREVPVRTFSWTVNDSK